MKTLLTLALALLLYPAGQVCAGAQETLGGAVPTVPAWASLPAEPAARAAALRGAVEAVLAAEAGPLSAASDCAAFSQIWLEKLNGSYGYRLLYAETAGMGDVALAAGGTARRDKTHYFLVDRTPCGANEPCDAEIIIDPTYMQFLRQGECLYGETEGCAGAGVLRALPRVLAGTRAEIKAFYSARSERVRLYSAGAPDLPAGSYDPAAAASLIYSFGPNAGLRSNIELLLPAR